MIWPRFEHVFVVFAAMCGFWRQGTAVLVEKWAGVHRGDPMSAILFIDVVEFVRRSMPAEARFARQGSRSPGSVFYMYSKLCG